MLLFALDFVHQIMHHFIYLYVSKEKQNISKMFNDSMIKSFLLPTMRSKGKVLHENDKTTQFIAIPYGY